MICIYYYASFRNSRYDAPDFFTIRLTQSKHRAYLQIQVWWKRAIYTAAPLKPLTNRVFIPIHKCADNFMSEDQHKEFFWPSLREIIIGLIDAGYVPYVYTEGEFGARLETIRDVPAGKVIYHIETPLFKAKDVLGDVACIEGGLSGPILNIGTPEEVIAETKRIIDYCGRDGGFIFGTELPMITAKPENVKAMVDTVKEYGVY